MKQKNYAGKIKKISGPLVIAENLIEPMINETVKIGKDDLFGEIIRIQKEDAMIQVYESTEGLRPGDKVEQTREMFKVELGPGLLKNVFDGIQRPLRGKEVYLKPGYKSFSLDRKVKWDFVPNKSIKKGTIIKGGEIIGSVRETNTTDHKILIPPNVEGEITYVADKGKYTIEKIIAKVETKKGKKNIKMYHKWPVMVPRPFTSKFPPKKPIYTGLRVLDFFFPATKGSTIGIPGGFGTGKTQLIFQLIKWSNADVLIYVGCGERGNEVITVLDEISKLMVRGQLLDERTVYIINTSNMPVAARTSGIFSGITLAEYFRDQGKNVVILADSITRWAEAMREMSNRIGDFPGEEGYPTYLSSQIGAFFERAGNVLSLAGEKGSITTIGSISLYGSDFSDPVAQASMKVVSCLWGLDPSLAYIRHYPAINREVSYSKFTEVVKDEWNKHGDWHRYYKEFLTLFGKIKELEKLTSIMGKDMISEKDRFLLQFYDLFVELFLKQNAYLTSDSHRNPEEQVKMAKLLLTYYNRGINGLENGIPYEMISNVDIQGKLMKLKDLETREYLDRIDDLLNELVFVDKK